MWCVLDISCFFISWLTILPIYLQFLQCILAQEQVILYTSAKLSGSLWSLGFLKICPIFLSDLKIIRVLYLFNILLIRFVVPLTYRRMDRILSSDCVSETVVLFACLLIVLIMSFVSCPFFCKSNFKWLSSICKCSLSEMMKALCRVNWLQIVFVLSGAIRHVDIYLCVLVFYTLDGLRYRQLS